MSAARLLLCQRLLIRFKDCGVAVVTIIHLLEASYIYNSLRYICYITIMAYRARQKVTL